MRAPTAGWSRSAFESRWRACSNLSRPMSWSIAAKCRRSMRSAREPELVAEPVREAGDAHGVALALHHVRVERGHQQVGDVREEVPLRVLEVAAAQRGAGHADHGGGRVDRVRREQLARRRRARPRPAPRPFALNGSVTSERPSSAAPRVLLAVATASAASSRSDSMRALHQLSSQAPPLCLSSSGLPASRENSTAKPASGASAPTWLAVRPRIDSKCDSDANSRDAVSSTESRWLSRVMRVSARFVITRSARNTREREQRERDARADPARDGEAVAPGRAAARSAAPPMRRRRPGRRRRGSSWRSTAESRRCENSECRGLEPISGVSAGAPGALIALCRRALARPARLPRGDSLSLYLVRREALHADPAPAADTLRVRSREGVR